MDDPIIRWRREPQPDTTPQWGAWIGSPVERRVAVAVGVVPDRRGRGHAHPPRPVHRDDRHAARRERHHPPALSDVAVMDDPNVAPASLNAARPGARVKVRSPQGSAYDDRTGTIRSRNGRTVIDGTVMVELDGIGVLPFALGELVALSSITR